VANIAAFHLTITGTMTTKVIPAREISRARRSSGTKFIETLFRPVMNKTWLTFKDKETEVTYCLDHSKRMKRGFLSSTLTRCCMFILVCALYAALFEGKADASALASISAVLVDVVLIAIQQLNLVPARKIQTLCCISCAIEGIAAIMAGMLGDFER